MSDVVPDVVASHLQEAACAEWMQRRSVRTSHGPSAYGTATRTSVSVPWDGFPNLSPLRAQPKTTVDRDENQRHGSAAARPGQIFKFVPRGRGPLCPPRGTGFPTCLRCEPNQKPPSTGTKTSVTGAPPHGPDKFSNLSHVAADLCVRPAGHPTAKPRPKGRQTRRSVGLRPACLSNQLPPHLLPVQSTNNPPPFHVPRNPGTPWAYERKTADGAVL
jgi:hypothetical protein